MMRNTLFWAAIALSLVIVQGCGGSGVYRSVGPSVGVGFYHHGYGGWGRGYYRGYNDATVDAVDTVDTIEAIDSIDTIDAIDDMGMPDMDMGADMDFDF